MVRMMMGGETEDPRLLSMALATYLRQDVHAAQAQAPRTPGDMVIVLIIKIVEYDSTYYGMVVVVFRVLTLLSYDIMSASPKWIHLEQKK